LAESEGAVSKLQEVQLIMCDYERRQWRLQERFFQIRE